MRNDPQRSANDLDLAPYPVRLGSALYVRVHDHRTKEGKHRRDGLEQYELSIEAHENSESLLNPWRRHTFPQPRHESALLDVNIPDLRLVEVGSEGYP